MFGLNNSEIAESYGVSNCAVWNIVNGVFWRHLLFPEEILHAL